MYVPAFALVLLKYAQALRLVKVREESAKRQAQLEERIIAPENDEFAPSKGKGSRATSIKRARPASSRRFASNLTPGDLDGKYKHDDEEDLSALCVHMPPAAQFFSNCPCRVKMSRKNKNWQPPPQSREIKNRAAVEFSSQCVFPCLCSHLMHLTNLLWQVQRGQQRALVHQRR